MNDSSRIINRPRAAPMSERGLDLYESPDSATLGLLSAETLPPFVWEPCSGRNAITGVLRAHWIEVYASDIVDYGTKGQDAELDFFACMALPDMRIAGIVSNPPYGRGLAAKFVRHALTLVPDVWALLPLTFLESIEREDILRPGSGFRRLLVFRERLPRMHRDGWQGKRASATQAFGWFCWQRGYVGQATIARISARSG